MPDSTKIAEVVQDWWGFLAFLLGSIASFLMGTKRSQWQLQQAREDIKKMDERLRQAERAMAEETVTVAEISATLKSVAENQNRILDAIQSLQAGKADK